MSDKSIFTDIDTDKNIVKHILAVLEIKKMIPVPQNLFKEVIFANITDFNYKTLLQKEYNFLLPLRDKIVQSAETIYKSQKETGVVHPFFCNFNKLETVYKSIAKVTNIQ